MCAHKCNDVRIFTKYTFYDNINIRAILIDRGVGVSGKDG